jgi:hypothetical protein
MSAAQSFTPGTGVNSAPASAQQRARPFCQAAKDGVQLAGNWSTQLSAASPQVGPVSLTASGGFLRRIILELVSTGGAGSGVGAADYPFNLPQLVRFSEPNNTPIVELSGFNLLLSNIYGGYVGVNDPRNDPDYSQNGNNPAIWPFIPIELDPTGMGALSDLSSSSGYQLTVQYNPASAIWTTAPTTLPAVALNAYSHYWTLPNREDMNGRPQATTPPFAGTVQLWNQISNIGLPAGGGAQRVQLNRMGNQLRTIVMVTRAAGARSDVPFPNPFSLRWDDVLLRNQDPQTLRKIMREYVNGMTARDVGVHVLPFSQGISRFVGGNGVSSYLPTVTDTRFELSGTFGAATTPTVDWLVNDVSSAPLSGLERTTVGGGLGYYPPAPAPMAGTQ